MRKKSKKKDYQKPKITVKLLTVKLSPRGGRSPFSFLASLEDY